MTKKDYIRRLVDTQQRVRSGETNILCPQCGHGTVIVSYTHFGNGRYGTWLQCNTCDMVEETYEGAPPPGFREDLINPRFQQLDEEAWARTQAKSGKDVRG